MCVGSTVPGTEHTVSQNPPIVVAVVPSTSTTNAAPSPSPTNFPTVEG